MIRSLCLLFLLSVGGHAACPSGPCLQAIYARGASPLSQSITLTTSGNMFHVWVCNPGAGGAPTISSSPSLTWTTGSGDDGVCASAFSVNVTTVQSYTVTATGGSPQFVVSEWKNLIASPYDVSAASGSFTSGTNWNTANVTTAQNNELFIGGLSEETVTNAGYAASGWTLALDNQDGGNGTDTALFFKTTNTAGTNNFSGTATTAPTHGSLDTFKATSAVISGSAMKRKKDILE